ncbi:hypothetical protein MKEN_00430100 [Mycena kentingensis (nom. inval.)]|nr:hypothetical protein MKEN_00430100 [Mycena kentingensis (nom. inval.)]
MSDNFSDGPFVGALTDTGHLGHLSAGKSTVVVRNVDAEEGGMECRVDSAPFEFWSLRVSTGRPGRGRGGGRREEGEEPSYLSHASQIHVLVVCRHKLSRRANNTGSIGAVDAGQGIRKNICRASQRTCLALSFFCAIKCSSARWSVKILNLAPSNKGNSAGQNRGGAGGIIQDGSLLGGSLTLAMVPSGVLNNVRSTCEGSTRICSMLSMSGRGEAILLIRLLQHQHRDCVRAFHAMAPDTLTAGTTRRGGKGVLDASRQTFDRANANLRIISYSDILQLCLTDVLEPLAAITTLIGFAKRQRARIQQSILRFRRVSLHANFVWGRRGLATRLCRTQKYPNGILNLDMLGRDVGGGGDSSSSLGETPSRSFSEPLLESELELGHSFQAPSNQDTGCHKPCTKAECTQAVARLGQTNKSLGIRFVDAKVCKEIVHIGLLGYL